MNPLDQPAEIAVTPAVHATAGGALRSPPAHLRLWLATVLGVAADFWTKVWAFEHITQRRVVIPGALSLQCNVNPGALFGMGKNMRWLFVIASIFAIAFVVYVFARSRPRQRSFQLALGFVLGGALGNLYDRLFNDGLVRDFIKFDLQIGTRLLWPWIFNVADVLLVAGVLLLVLNIWLDRAHPQRLQEPA